MNAKASDSAMAGPGDATGHEAYCRFLERVIAEGKIGPALPELSPLFAALGASVIALAQGNGHSRQTDVCILAPIDAAVRERVIQRVDRHFPAAGERDGLEGEVAVRCGSDRLRPAGSAAPESWAEWLVGHGPSSRVRGLLLVAAPSEKMPDPVRSAGENLARELGTVLDAVERMNELSTRDPLTGLYNRRGLDEEMRRIWNQCDRSSQPVSLLFLDMDNLRIINDTHGHLMGDQVIRELAEVLGASARAQDLAARYGGDEMVVVLPATRSEDARIYSERLLENIRRTEFGRPHHHLRVSVSIGIAGGKPGQSGYSIEQLIQDGDHALMEAKQNGRDQLRVHTAGSAPASGAADPADAVTAGSRSNAGHILVVDDEKPVAQMLSRYLSQQGHTVATAFSARQAMEILRQSGTPFALLITDMNMPDESGLDLMAQVSAFNPDIVMIVITGGATIENTVSSLRQGAFDFLQKPVQLEELGRMVKRAIEYHQLRVDGVRYRTRLESLVESRGEQLKQAFSAIRQSYEYTLEALASLLDAREKSTGQHSLRVRDISLCAGGAIGMSDAELDRLDRAALLHDIGKIAIPDAILLKPGPLTDAEMRLMRTHVDVGYRILSAIPYLADAARIVQAHHERFDGTGYPLGLKGDDIPLAARLFTVVDSYDAIRSPRPYHAGHSAGEALRRIDTASGTQFDPQIVDAFKRIHERVEELGRWDILPQVPAAAWSAGDFN